MTPIRYNMLWVLAVLAIVVLCAAVNIAIDPYHVFGTQRWNGLNAKKTEAAAYAAMTKPYQIERVRPATVLLGTSRVAMGLDPTQGAWPTELQPVYNYALPGSSIAWLMRQLHHAMSVGPVRTVVVGLEFQDVLRSVTAENAVLGEAEGRFLALSQRGGWPRVRQQINDWAVASSTMGAFVSSVSTLTGQHLAFAGDMSDGGLTSGVPFAGVVRTDGHHDLFLQKDRMLVRGGQKAGRIHGGKPVDAVVELSDLQALIDFCQANGIELHLLLLPYHAHYLEILDAVGLWDRFEHWKRALRQLVLTQRQRTGQRIALWDFATYSEHTTEAVPRKGDRVTEMRWFWETLHFKKGLGDLVLDRVFAGGNAVFGAPLAEVDIEDHLRADRERRAVYRREHVLELQQLQRLVDVPRQTGSTH